MRLIALSLALTLISTASWAAPRHVIIIRHAEKPADNKDDGGSLSSVGWERARRLVGYFNNTLSNTYGEPVAIFAFRNRKSGKRFRAIETVTPLAASLELGVDSNFKQGEETALVSYILKAHRFDGKTVLICWEHKLIHKILESLNIHDAPNYPDEAYDRTYVVDLNQNGEVSGFHDFAQDLMPGDSKN